MKVSRRCEMKKDKHVMDDIKESAKETSEKVKEAAKETAGKVKEAAKETVEKVKEFAKDVETKVNERKDFKRHSVSVKRLNTKMFNFDTKLYGVFDEEALTLTYQIKDEYGVNEMLEIGNKMFQVKSINAAQVKYPVLVDNEESEVDCRVAVLQPVDKVS